MGLAKMSKDYILAALTRKFSQKIKNSRPCKRDERICMISRGTTQISVQHSLHSSLTRNTASTTQGSRLRLKGEFMMSLSGLHQPPALFNQAFHHYYSLSKSFVIDIEIL